MMIRAGILALTLALTPASSLAAEFSARIWQSEEGLPGNVVRSIGHELIVDRGFNSMSI